MIRTLVLITLAVTTSAMAQTPHWLAEKEPGWHLDGSSWMHMTPQHTLDVVESRPGSEVLLAFSTTIAPVVQYSNNYWMFGKFPVTIVLKGDTYIDTDWDVTTHVNPSDDNERQWTVEIKDPKLLRQIYSDGQIKVHYKDAAGKMSETVWPIKNAEAGEEAPASPTEVLVGQAQSAIIKTDSGTRLEGQNAGVSQQVSECQKVVAERANPVIPPSVCTMLKGLLAPDEQVVKVNTIGVLAVRGGVLKDHKWPRKLSTSFMLAESKQYVRDIEQESKIPGFATANEAAALAIEKSAWEKSRELYCDYHPGDAYSDLADQRQVCPDNTVGGGASSNSNAAIPTHPVPFSVPPGAVRTKTCQKAITFAMAQHGSMVYQLPNVPAKWLDKAQKKYPNVCFLQSGARSGEENYLIVLSSSSGAYTGLQPVFHRTTTIDPISGSGTVTTSAGSTWDFTYQGTITTTTTTQSNALYRDTTTGFYANAYSENGSVVGTSERSTSSRQGGDPSNALGYNLTSALLSIHLKEHLLEDIVKKVSALP